MDVKKCDRCGKYYEHSRPVMFPHPLAGGRGMNLAISGILLSIGRATDLCQNCQDDLADFFRFDKSGNYVYPGQ